MQVMNELKATSITQTKYNKEETIFDCDNGLTERELALRIDLADVMNLHPTSVHQDTPFQRAYRIFQASGLRHLYVHDEEFQMVGVITREDLFAVESRGHEADQAENISETSQTV